MTPKAKAEKQHQKRQRADWTMAIYEWQMQTINRADGRSTVAAAAYRAGVRLEDERTGEVHDFTRKRGIDFSALVGWTASRDALWNAVEFAEKRKDSRLAREIVVAIPAELSKELREALMLEYAEALRSRWGVAVDFSIHKPHGKGSDARNVHAHLMLTSRTCVDNQLGEKTRVLDNNRTSGEEIEWARKCWEDHANASLKAIASEARIDSRSLKDRGIDRKARVHLGHEQTAMERRGIATDGGEHNRDVDDAEELARLDAETAKAKKREDELKAELGDKRDPMILAARQRLTEYQTALIAGPPKLRVWSLDDFVDEDKSSGHLEKLRHRRKDWSQKPMVLRLKYPFACWLQKVAGVAVNGKASEFQKAIERVEAYAMAERKLRQEREALQSQHAPLIAERQALADIEFEKLDQRFTEAVNNHADPDLRKLAARSTEQEKKAALAAAVVPVVADETMKPPQPKPTMARRLRPGWMQ